MSDNNYVGFLKSMMTIDGFCSIGSILEWIKKENLNTQVILSETIISNNSFWFYDESNGLIRNSKNSFFTIRGIKNNDIEQPIIFQNEVGYLGFICKRINGLIHILVQAKIEPGNINKVQISPTIQATKSNFTRAHGGRAPYFLDYFKNSSNYNIIYDGEEPEQCSRFYKKYNRNVILLLGDDDDIAVSEHFKWMTIGQIKYIANNYNNLVNMDTRTVLSCIPYDLGNRHSGGSHLINSIFGEDSSVELIQLIKKHQMNTCSPAEISLNQIHNWVVNRNGIFCNEDYPFCIKYYDIHIEGREVENWMQPLAVANGRALFALAYVVHNSTMYFLIKIKDEIGCDFGSSFGPTIQTEAPYEKYEYKNEVEKDIYNSIMNNKCDIDTILSEEGGRFYHEENRNVVCKLSEQYSIDEITKMNYYPVTYKTIRNLIGKSHMVNIQLRNLLSLLMDNYEKN